MPFCMQAEQHISQNSESHSVPFFENEYYNKDREAPIFIIQEVPYAVIL